MWQDQQYSLWDRAILMQTIKDGFQIKQLQRRYKNSTQEDEKKRLEDRMLYARFWAGPRFDRGRNVACWPAEPKQIPEALCHLIRKGNSDAFIQILGAYLQRKPLPDDSLDDSLYYVFFLLGQKILDETKTLLKQEDVSAVVPVCFVLNLCQWMETVLWSHNSIEPYVTTWITTIIDQAFPSPPHGQKDQRVERFKNMVNEATPENKLLMIRAFSWVYNRSIHFSSSTDDSAFVTDFKDLLMTQVQNTNAEEFIEVAEQAIVAAMSRLFFLHFKNGGSTADLIFDLKSEFVKGTLRSDILWQFIANLCEVFHKNGASTEYRNYAMKLFDKLLEESVLQNGAAEENRDPTLSILEHEWLENKLTARVDGRWQIWRSASSAHILERKWNKWKKHQLYPS